MLRTLFRRAVQTARGDLPIRSPVTVVKPNNGHPTKKIWPPNYDELTHQEMLRFEKKYKRRVLLATRRPRWDKGIKLAQLGTVVFVLGFVLLFGEIELLGEKYRPNERIRHAVRTLGGIFADENRYKTTPPPLPSSAIALEPEIREERK